MDITTPMPVPECLEMLAERIQRDFPEGCKLYVVGGAVRDWLLGIEPADWDLCITGFTDPTIARRSFNTIGATTLAGTNMPVLMFRFTWGGREETEMQSAAREDGIQNVQIALARNEVAAIYSSYDAVDFFFHDTDGLPVTIENDLKRRDITWNAMAWDILERELIDPYGGVADIESGIIRLVDPHWFITSIERPMRIGVMLARDYGRYITPEITVDPEVYEVCKDMAPHAGIGMTHRTAAGMGVAAIPQAQVFEQFKKAMKAPRFDLFLSFLKDINWLPLFDHLNDMVGCPQDPVHHPEGDVWTHTLHVLRWAQNHLDEIEANEVLRYRILLACLCHDLDKPPVTELKDLISGEHITFDAGFGPLWRFLESEDYDPEKYRVVSYGHDSGFRTEAFLRQIGPNYMLQNEVLKLVQCHMTNQHFQDGWSRRQMIRLLRKLEPASFDDLLIVMQADTNGRPPLPPKLPAGIENMNEAIASIKLDFMGQPDSPFQGRHLIEWGLDKQMQGFDTPFWGDTKREDSILGLMFMAQQEGFFGDPNDPDPRWVEEWVKAVDWKNVNFRLRDGVKPEHVVEDLTDTGKGFIRAAPREEENES